MNLHHALKRHLPSFFQTSLCAGICLFSRFWYVVSYGVGVSDAQRNFKICGSFLIFSWPRLASCPKGCFASSVETQVTRRDGTGWDERAPEHDFLVTSICWISNLACPQPGINALLLLVCILLKSVLYCNPNLRGPQDPRASFIRSTSPCRCNRATSRVLCAYCVA